MLTEVLLGAAIVEPLAVAAVAAWMARAGSGTAAHTLLLAGSAIHLTLSGMLAYTLPGQASIAAWLDAGLLTAPIALVATPGAVAVITATSFIALVGASRRSPDGVRGGLLAATGFLALALLAKQLILLLLGWLGVGLASSLALRQTRRTARLHGASSGLLLVGTLILLYYSQGDPDLTRLPQLLFDAGPLSDAANRPTVAALCGVFMTAAGAACVAPLGAGRAPLMIALGPLAGLGLAMRVLPDFATALGPAGTAGCAAAATAACGLLWWGAGRPASLAARTTRPPHGAPADERAARHERLADVLSVGIVLVTLVVATWR